jgi:hypothetical protein
MDTDVFAIYSPYNAVLVEAKKPGHTSNFIAFLALGIGLYQSGNVVMDGPGQLGATRIGYDESTMYTGVVCEALTIYNGTQTSADPHLARFVSRAPVYKGLTYVVFQDFNLGNNPTIPNFNFEVTVLPYPEYEGATDVTPPEVSKHVLTNDLFGLGLDKTYLNLPIFADSIDYCRNNDFYVSFAFERQSSVLDVLSHIIQHHNGFITYYDGQIAHNQMKVDTPIASLNTSDVVQNEYPIEITKKGSRDYNNKVIVEWTKRSDDYCTGTVIADDDLDISMYGLKDVNIQLDGMCTYERAYKIANLLLEKNIINPEVLKFKLGPKSIGLKPGDVIDITDTNLEMSNFKVRIASIRETEDYTIEVEAIEELDNIHNYIVNGADTSFSGTITYLTGVAGDVIRPQIYEVDPLYSGSSTHLAIGYSKSGLVSWAGATLYMAYAEGGPYFSLDSKFYSGITGIVDTVGITLTDVAYIDVTLDWDYTLSSATTVTEFLSNTTMNLFITNTTSGDKYIRFQDVSLLAANKWRLYNLLYDVTNSEIPNSYGDVTVSNVLLFYNKLPFYQLIGSADSNKELFFKIASFNFAGIEQSLADITPISIDLASLVSVSPSISHSISPSISPSIASPSISHSVSPSLSPSVSISPSKSPSVSVSKSPSVSPSVSPSISKSPSVSPSVSPSTPPSHRYWRVYIASVDRPNGYAGMAEVELRTNVGGSDETGAGTASASSEYSGCEANKAVDNDAGTYWYSGNGTVPHWWKYDFGNGVTKDIVEVAITSVTGYEDSGPKHFHLEYSDDGNSWTELIGWDTTWPTATQQIFN